jgi:hemerythrin-like domain-containing protein
MTAVDRLFDEHVLILKVAEALSVFVDRLESDEADHRNDLVRLMTFFREFADLLHHEKEESLLLPALVHAGMRWDDGIIAEIRKEHELERQMLQTLRHASLQSSPWSLMDLQRVIDVGRRFIEFTRKHIDTEEARLLPSVSTRLDGPALSELNEHLDRFDARLEISGELAMLRELAAHLSQEFVLA